MHSNGWKEKYERKILCNTLTDRVEGYAQVAVRALRRGCVPTEGLENADEPGGSED